MTILIDILEEHQENVEDLKKLPKPGDVIIITERDTSLFKGATKEKVGQYVVSDLMNESRMVVTTHAKCAYKECFSFYDLLSSDCITWNHA